MVKRRKDSKGVVLKDGNIKDQMALMNLSGKTKQVVENLSMRKL